MNRTAAHDAVRSVTLPNDFGASFAITGSMLAEDIHFSPETGVLTVEKLYRTQDGRLGYGIISASGESRERRAYLLDDQGGDTVLAANGACELELPVDALHEFLAMCLQAEDASAMGEHQFMRPAVNED